MTTFEDGPAKGQTLMLHRAARFLRVTLGAGKWDALDQPDDAPRENEVIYAYLCVGEPGMCHIYRRGRNSGSGFYAIGKYRFIDPQPADDQMRTTEAWHRWVDNKAKEMGLIK